MSVKAPKQIPRAYDVKPAWPRYTKQEGLVAVMNVVFRRKHS